MDMELYQKKSEALVHVELEIDRDKTRLEQKPVTVLEHRAGFLIEGLRCALKTYATLSEKLCMRMPQGKAEALSPDR